MELDENIHSADTELNLKRAEVEENLQCGVDSDTSKANTEIKLKEVDDKEHIEHPIGCEELKDYRNRCNHLETKILEKVIECEVVEAKLGLLELEKLAIEDELKDFKRRTQELEERVAQIENDDERVVQLMIENRVLECEKKKAENEVDVWKTKFRELESRVLNKSKDGLDIAAGLECMKIKEEMVDKDEKDGATMGRSTSRKLVKQTGDPQMEAGTPFTETPHNSEHGMEGTRGIYSRTRVQSRKRIKKQLTFEQEQEGAIHKKLAPSTPGSAKPGSAGVVEISDSDSDEEHHDEAYIKHVHVHTSQNVGSKNRLKKRRLNPNDENENSPSFSTPKRKRAPNIVTTSEEECDDDDAKVSICKSKQLPELYEDHLGSQLNDDAEEEFVTPPRRRLVKLRERGDKGGEEEKSPKIVKTRKSPRKPRAIPETELVQDDETEDDSIASEDESSDGFIVYSSEVSDESDSSSVSGDVSDDESDSNASYGEIISRIRRKRDEKSEWDFEAEMLSAFGKDPELCMKAVCALYRQQTSEEKSVKGTLITNNRGFSKFDALRGSKLAEFLTEGDPQGDVKKSVKELKKYDPEGPETCRGLATHYSKQLFTIYKNKEDPLFLPC